MEYHKDSIPQFTIEGKPIIYKTQFCFTNNSITFCRDFGDFKDERYGISCDYTMFGSHNKYDEKSQVTTFLFDYQIDKPLESIYPISFDLGAWPKKMITDEFEEDVSSGVVELSPFALTGENRSIVFVKPGDYHFIIEKTDKGVSLKLSPNKIYLGNYESKIEWVPVSKEINKSELHEPIGVIESPPVWGVWSPEQNLTSERIISQNITIVPPIFTGNVWNIAPSPHKAETEIIIKTNLSDLDYIPYLTLVFGDPNQNRTKHLDFQRDEYQFKEALFYSGNRLMYPFDTYITKLYVENATENGTFKEESKKVHMTGEYGYEAFQYFERDQITIKLYHDVYIKVWYFLGLLFFCMGVVLIIRQIKYFKKSSLQPKNIFNLYNSIGTILLGIAFPISFKPLQNFISLGGVPFFVGLIIVLYFLKKKIDILKK